MKWKPALGHEGRYEVSDEGQVRSLETRDVLGRRRAGRVLKPYHAGPMGYEYVALYTGMRRRPVQRTVHSLVLEAFVGPRPAGLWGRHIDGDHLNNKRANLAWGTPIENAHDTLAHNHHPEALKTHCPRNHPLAEPNLVPSQWRRGVRSCLACARAHSLARQRGHKITQQLADQKYTEIVRHIKKGTERE